MDANNKVINYSVDVNLFGYLNENKNLTEEQKAKLYDDLNMIKYIYDKFIDNYTFDNVSEIIKNLKLEVKGDGYKTIYDKNSNTLILGDSENNEYNIYKSLLELTSQSYNSAINAYNSGLIVTSDDGMKYGENLNNLVIDKIITYTTGYSNKEESIAQNDELLIKITDKVSAEELITYFAYGNGAQLYKDIFDDKENEKMFS